MSMTRRERLRRCYFHEETDRPGVYVRTGFPGNDPTYDRLKALLAEQTERKSRWSAPSLLSAPPTETRLEPHTEDFQRRATVLHTPAGDLTSSRLVSLKGQPGLHETYLLKTPEDAETYLSLPLPDVVGDVSGFFAADEAMGDAGVTEVYLGRSPGGAAVELFGSEQFAMLSVTDRDVLHALAERQQQILFRTLDVVLAAGTGPLFNLDGEEYLAPPLHSPEDFHDFICRYEKPVFDRIHDAGGRVHVHCHGRVKKLLPHFIEMGVDVLHPIEPPPMGDVTAAEAKEMLRGRITIEGNIQIADFHDRTPEEIRARTEALIRDAWDDRRGLIVCPTASPYLRGFGERDFARYAAMIETVRDWRQ